MKDWIDLVGTKKILNILFFKKIEKKLLFLSDKIVCLTHETIRNFN